MKNLLPKIFKFMWDYCFFWILSFVYFLLQFILGVVIGVVIMIALICYAIVYPFVVLHWKMFRHKAPPDKWINIVREAVFAVPNVLAVVLPEILINVGWKEEDNDCCGC